MEIWGNILDMRVNSETFVTRNQFGCMPGTSKIKLIYIL